MPNEISIEFEGVKRELIQAISAFNEEEFNTIPFKGSWTAGQVAEHVYKSVSAFTKGLYGKVKPTTRQPDEKVEPIRKAFMDFDTKMSSPDFILPSNAFHDKNAILSSLKSTMDKISEAIKKFDLSETCLSFVPPAIGELTRLESIYFVIYHTKRHIHQLKNISSKLRIVSRE